MELINAFIAKLSRAHLAAFLALLWMSAIGCGQNSQSQAPGREESQNAARERQSSGRYDLERDESRGGHTLTRHVARSNEQLLERLQKERNISAASTWTDRQAAEETVAAALLSKRDRIDSWLRRGERRSNLALHFDAGRPIGRSLRRDASEAVTCTSAVVVLKADGPNSYYVLTTYPEARE
jgi:hypothetical protein